MNREEENIKHPAFAQIYFSRVSGGGQKFYGSELPQDHYITMELHNSEISRELTQDRYYNTGVPVVKVRMTSGQFAEMITSMNIGTGVCCTLERREGKKVEDLPEVENRKEFVHRKFEDRMKDFSSTMVTNKNRVKELTSKKTLSKADQHELNMLVEGMTQEISSNIPFFAKCFQETMDEVVFEAKLEVENAIQHKITTLGLEALHDQNKLLR